MNTKHLKLLPCTVAVAAILVLSACDRSSPAPAPIADTTPPASGAMAPEAAASAATSADAHPSAPPVTGTAEPAKTPAPGPGDAEGAAASSGLPAKK